MKFEASKHESICKECPLLSLHGIDSLYMPSLELNEEYDLGSLAEWRRFTAWLRIPALRWG